METRSRNAIGFYRRRLADPEKRIRRLVALVGRTDPEHHPSRCR